MVLACCRPAVDRAQWVITSAEGRPWAAMPLVRRRLLHSGDCPVPTLPANSPKSRARRHSSSERGSEALACTRRLARDLRSSVAQPDSRRARHLGSSCRGGRPVRPRSRWRGHRDGAAKSSSQDGSTGRPSWTNRASMRRSAGEVDRLDRARLIDVAGPPAPPGELGERSWVTRAERERRHGNPIELTDEPGLIVVELAGDQNATRSAQLLDQLAHRPVARWIRLIETPTTGFVAGPQQATSAGADDRDDGRPTRSVSEGRSLECGDADQWHLGGQVKSLDHTEPDA